MKTESSKSLGLSSLIAISSFLSLTMIGAIASASVDLSFTDVEDEHSNLIAIEYLQAEGIVGGYDDGSFKPSNTVNRAEFLKIVVGASAPDLDVDSVGTSLDGLANRFSDLHEGEWYVPYLKYAVDTGIVDGYPDGTFRPSDEVNFVEAAKIIAEAFDAPVSEADVWYEPYVEELEDWSAIPFDIEGLESEVTRAQMSEMIYRIHSGEDSLPSSGLDVLSGTQQYWEFDQATYEALLGEKAMILYFHADWCPTCVALESYLVTNMDSFPEGTIFLQVDFDTETELRQEYEVVGQFTFVVLDAEGDVVEKLTTNNVAYVRLAMETALGL